MSRSRTQLSARLGVVFLLIAFISLVWGCGGEDPVRTVVTPTPDPSPEPTLRDESTLTCDCYSWPAVEFDRDHHANLGMSVAAGDPAIDFTLETPDGEAHSLRDLLRERPVLMVLGGFT